MKNEEYIEILKQFRDRQGNAKEDIETFEFAIKAVKCSPKIMSDCYYRFIKFIIDDIKVRADARYFVYKDTDNEKEKGFVEGMRYASNVLMVNRPYFEKYFLEEVNKNEDK